MVHSRTMQLNAITPLPPKRRLMRRRRSRQTMKAYLRATTTLCFFLLSRGAAFSLPSGILSSRAAGDLPRLDDAKPIATHHVHFPAGAVPRCPTRLHNSFPQDDPSVAAQIEKAKRLLEDARKKQKEQEAAAASGAEAGSQAEGEDSKLPFFAAKSHAATAAEHARKIKSTTASGEIVADGAAMATMSQSEPWEVRSLDQMFDKEARMDYDGNEVEGEGSGLAERDLAASIYNLRKALQNDDFRKVFNSRNRFIGEVD